MTAHKKSKSQSKDSPQRSILKAISWRFVASGSTFIISFTVFTQATETAFRDILGAVSLITAVDIVAKLVLYYLHERLWTNIQWGKSWRRRAWRRHYRKMHELQAKQQKTS
jgi:uncharacterized membrane protein